MVKVQKNGFDLWFHLSNRGRIWILLKRLPIVKREDKGYNKASITCKVHFRLHKVSFGIALVQLGGIAKIETIRIHKFYLAKIPVP